jgi:hypothetical protein
MPGVRAAAWGTAALLCALGVFAWWSHGERLRLRAHARSVERRVVELERVLADRRARASDTGVADERARERIARLEAELAGALERERQSREIVALERARIEAEQAALREQRQRSLAPMPEGVRLALVRANELLRADGFGRTRFVHARALDPTAHELLDAELIDHDPRSLVTVAHVAGRVRFALDRASSTLRIRLFDGRVVRGEVPEAYPEEGEEIVFHGVDAPAWEARLPNLVVAEGVAPPIGGAAAVKPPPPSLDPLAVANWQAILQRVLDESSTRRDYRVGALRDLVDGEFREVVVLGYDRDTRLLEFAADAEALVVEVDDAAGTASLCLSGGRIRQKGGTTDVPASGFRILLDGLTPDRARQVMLGVVREAP